MKWLLANAKAWFDPAQDGLPAAPCARAATPRCAGIVYADIANYSQLVAQDEPGTQRRLDAAIRIMMANVADNRGRIAHLAGDAVLAEFDDADSALHCALRVQMAARQWNADRAVDHRVLFRIGVHLGAAVESRADARDSATRLAERLQKLASSGGVCVFESNAGDRGARPGIRVTDADGLRAAAPLPTGQACWIEIDHQGVIDPALTTAVKVSAVSS